MAGLETKLVWNGDKKKVNMNDAIYAALVRATNKVQADAKLLVPKYTGNLRASIVKTVDRSKQIGTVLTNSEYAFYVEFGTGRYAEGGEGRSTPWVYKDSKGNFRWTVGHEAQPYMRPALSNNKANIEKIFIQEGKKAVDK